MATIDKNREYGIPEGTVAFDKVEVDIGNNFIKQTGEFTAPKAGVYLFMVDAHSDATFHKWNSMRPGVILFKVNGRTIKDLSELPSSAGAYYEINGLVVTELEAGDVVTLFIDQYNLQIDYGNLWGQKEQIRGGNKYGTQPFTFLGTFLSDIESKYLLLILP